MQASPDLITYASRDSHPANVHGMLIQPHSHWFTDGCPQDTDTFACTGTDYRHDRRSACSCVCVQQCTIPALMHAPGGRPLTPVGPAPWWHSKWSRFLGANCARATHTDYPWKGKRRSTRTRKKTSEACGSSAGLTMDVTRSASSWSLLT